MESLVACPERINPGFSSSKREILDTHRFVCLGIIEFHTVFQHLCTKFDSDVCCRLAICLDDWSVDAYCKVCGSVLIVVLVRIRIRILVLVLVRIIGCFTSFKTA